MTKTRARRVTFLWDTTHENGSLLGVCWPIHRQFAQDRCGWAGWTELENSMPQRTAPVVSAQLAERVRAVDATLERTGYTDTVQS